MILVLLLACEAHVDEARVARAAAALEKGDMVAAEAEITAVEDPVVRDMMRLALAADHPQRASELCAATTTAYGKEKCQQVLGRPHLQSVKP